MKAQIALKQSTISSLILGVFFLIAVLLIGSIVYMRSSIQSEQAAERRRTEFKQLGMDLADASDYLTDEARKYAITTDTIHLRRYWEEINNTQTRDKVILKLRELESSEEELELLAQAKMHSDALVNTERRSMRLVLEALNVQEKDMAPEVASYNLDSADKTLGNSDKLNKAREIMFDAQYDSDKRDIMNPIAQFQKVMNARLENELEAARNATSKAAVVQIVLALIIICSIAVLIGTLFKYVTYPVNSYTRRLRKLSFEDDKFSLTPEGTLELQQLANTFNELYFSFHSELQKRREAENIMRAAKEEAELANNAKSEFLASMSHEIRTPLNTIIGYQYLLNETRLEVKQRDYCDKIGMVADNLLGLINSILDFSKIEAGKMVLENVEFDIVKTVQDIYKMVGVDAEKKGLGFSLNVNKNIPRILLGDVIRVKQVLLNLLSNAIKFTDQGAVSINLDFTVESEGSIFVCMEVEDTGIGISEEQMKVIFDHFTQADASITRKYGGTGLGLAICRRISELMNGTITAKSEPGKGSSFAFKALFSVVDCKECLKEENDRKIVVQDFINKKILLVEDNETNLAMTKEILDNMGFITYTAASGRAAIELAVSNKFDVILMDIRMPDMDGYETTKRIRELETVKETVIIALTADAVEGVAEKARMIGMNGFLTKPLYPAKLSRELNGLMPHEYKQWVAPDYEYDCDIDDRSNETDCAAFGRGVARLGGDRHRYSEILNKFIEEHKDDGEKIKALYLSGNIPELREVLHRLKGITGNIGSIELFELCRNLESLLEGHMEQPLMAQVHISDSIDSIIFRLTGFCREAIVFIDQNKILEEGLDEADADANISIVIDTLNRYLAIADSEAKEYFVRYSRLFEGMLEKELYFQLRKSIMEFDFEMAEQFLSTISVNSN